MYELYVCGWYLYVMCGMLGYILSGFWINCALHSASMVALGETCNGLSLILTCDFFLFFPISFIIAWSSLDSRGGGSLKHATHSALASDLGQRLYFSAENNPKDARLQIKNVILSDGGVYRCRVDFFNAATRNLRVNLSLVGKCILSLMYFFPDLFNIISYKERMRFKIMKHTACVCLDIGNG